VTAQNLTCVVHNQVTGPLFFQEATINIYTHLEMLEVYAVHRTEQLQPRIILQQARAPAHWILPVRSHLVKKFPGRWIG
jgi:hypothetical protein